MLSLLAILAVNSGTSTIPTEFYDYLAKPDKSFKYSAGKIDNGQQPISLTSQTWQGIPWKHSILLQAPKKPSSTDTAILFITGDGPRPGDMNVLRLMSDATGMPVAMLFDIPNQPIWGMKEDDLISHTFVRYMRSGDPTWPLLFPMAKSAIRAMDAVQSISAANGKPIKHFVVTGASKRGWTTWFVGAAKDKRVSAIAPMVIDNLNLAAQMKHQLESWGKYSEQIEDYTRKGIQAKLVTDSGKRLSIIADPYSYRQNIKVPTLIVKGSNDPYWTVDAMDQYWNDLRMPKWIVNVPNAGHNLGNGFMAIESVGAFARAVSGEFKLPAWNAKFTESRSADNRSVSLRASSAKTGFYKLMLWAAESDTLDFRPSEYKVVGEVSINPAGERTQPTIRVPLSSTRNTAMFGEMRYRVNGREFSLSTLTKVYKK